MMAEHSGRNIRGHNQPCVKGSGRPQPRNVARRPGSRRDSLPIIGDARPPSVLAGEHRDDVHLTQSVPDNDRGNRGL